MKFLDASILVEACLLMHAEVARHLGCQTICTLNEAHFRHVARDLKIETL